jgi:hypothetical protein
VLRNELAFVGAVLSTFLNDKFTTYFTMLQAREMRSHLLGKKVIRWSSDARPGVSRRMLLLFQQLKRMI